MPENTSGEQPPSPQRGDRHGTALDDSDEAAQLAAEDPAAHGLRLAKEFQDFSRRAEAAGDDTDAARHRRVSDGYLDDVISKGNGE